MPGVHRSNDNFARKQRDLILINRIQLQINLWLLTHTCRYVIELGFTPTAGGAAVGRDIF